MTPKKFDGEGFFAALDAERLTRTATWKKVAEEAGVPASTLTRMSQGKRPDIDTLAALCQWSGLEPGRFTGQIDTKPGGASTLSEITTLLRGDKHLSKEGVQALEAILKTAYAQLKRD
ncbi:transcriptional regulator [Agrobacterium sp. ICMP 7243]|jgi:transcriptional regulator with XRE-family HTH domain|uniref:helix-turn-helix domain-containing protein n=1 Tax=Rhizobium rhizogenes TaxID=359 RepID=UPI0006461D04|nr:helix-turn-helix transcriptional regulator [Rhizobium rhizogenes]KAA6489944.1 transcriptional regulator [Agrobacterium sp. ICMP 7243]